MAETPANTGLSSGQALQRLLDGNKRYVSEQLAHPNETAARRREVAQVQHPFACILGCADSRVPVEIVFDQGLGDLFVVRVAGNIASDVAVLGSLEYAVMALGIPLIVVLGHEGCGAVRAAVEALTQETAIPGHLQRLVAAIQPAVTAVRSRFGDPLDNAVRANIEMTAEILRSSAPILAPAVRAGQLRVVGARYNLSSGLVDVIA